MKHLLTFRSAILYMRYLAIKLAESLSPQSSGNAVIFEFVPVRLLRRSACLLFYLMRIYLFSSSIIILRNKIKYGLL